MWQYSRFPVQSWRLIQRESKHSQRPIKFCPPSISSAAATLGMERLRLSASRCWHWEPDATEKDGWRTQDSRGPLAATSQDSGGSACESNTPSPVKNDHRF